MDFYSNMDCLLKVNVHCEACKMKMIEVLGSICGVYSVSIDAKEGTAKVSGEVDPNMVLKALGRSGKHAELVWVKLKHPKLDRRLPPSSSSSSYGAIDHREPSSYFNGYRNRPMGLPQQSYYYDAHQHYYPQTRQQLPYNSVEYNYPSSYSTNNYHYNSPLPPAQYVPSAPQPVYDPYDNYESISFCSIM